MAASPVGMKRFYGILGALAVAGIGLLGYQMAKPATVSIPANVTVQPSDTAGFHGYVKGSEAAPVEITEYADYQCPFCQTFATLQMPAIEEHLIKTGRLRWRYRDFPLQQHPYSRRTRPPAPTSRESSGRSTRRSTRASPSGRPRGTRPASSAATRAKWGSTSAGMTPAWPRTNMPAASRRASRKGPDWA